MQKLAYINFSLGFYNYPLYKKLMGPADGGQPLKWTRFKVKFIFGIILTFEVERTKENQNEWH